MSLPQVWAFLACALPALVPVAASGAADLAYQIRAGDVMLRTHAFVRADPFSFTATGHEWLNQQWLAQVTFATVYRALGWPGLRIFQAGLVATTFGLVYLGCRAAGSVAMRSALLALAGFVVAFTGLALRPQLLGAALFSTTLWILTGRLRHPGRLWLIPVLVGVWANVHGSFFLGPLLTGLVWLDDLSRRSPTRRLTLKVAALSLLATFLNPFGPHLWTYAVGISTNPLISCLVTEWQPPVIRRFDDLLFFVSVALVALILVRRERPATWPQLATILTFLAIALTATRNTLWWALAIPPTIAGIVEEPQNEHVAAEAASLLNTAIVACLVALFAAFSVVSLEGSSRRSPGNHAANAPLALTAGLRHQLRPGDRVFNAQAWGSWFELALPRNPVFVDSRVELFPASVWNDYLAVSSGRQGWQEILRRWDVRAVVAKWSVQARLIPLIRRDREWRLVYQDKDGLVFVRR